MRFRTACLLLTTVLLIVSANAEDPKLRERAHALLQKGAASVADENYHLPSYHLEAKFKLMALEQHDIEGQYVRDFDKPEQWRSRVSTSDFSEVEVRNGGRIWRKRSADYVPLRIEQVLRAMPPQFGRLPNTDIVNPIDATKLAGSPATCISITIAEGESKTPGRICLEDATGALLLHERSGYRYQYSKNVTFGKYTLPGHLEVFDRGIKVAEADLAFSAPGAWNSETFVAPADYESRKVCTRYIAPVLIHKEVPQFPKLALQAGMSGIAGMKVHIGVDGHVYKPMITETAGSVLNAAAIDAVKKWTYEPARCDGEPQDIETTLRIDFQSLRY